MYYKGKKDVIIRFMSSPRRMPSPSKAELRAARTRKRAAREAKQATSTIGIPSRQVVTMYDAQGKIIYDRDTGASAFETNLPSLRLSLIGRTMLARLINRHGEDETKSRLETVCDTLAPSSSVGLDAINVFGSQVNRYANQVTSYVVFTLDGASNKALSRQERAAIYSEFELPFSRYAGHISFHYTGNANRASLIQEETEGRLALPGTALLDRAVLGPSMAL
jgi:hypothetical protein